MYTTDGYKGKFTKEHSKAYQDDLVKRMDQKGKKLRRIKVTKK